MASINRNRYKGLGRPRKADYESFKSLVGVLVGTGIFVYVGEYLIKVLS